MLRTRLCLIVTSDSFITLLSQHLFHLDRCLTLFVLTDFHPAFSPTPPHLPLPLYLSCSKRIPCCSSLLAILLFVLKNRFFREISPKFVRNSSEKKNRSSLFGVMSVTDAYSKVFLPHLHTAFVVLPFEPSSQAY